MNASIRAHKNGPPQNSNIISLPFVNCERILARSLFKIGSETLTRGVFQSKIFAQKVCRSQGT